MGKDSTPGQLLPLRDDLSVLLGVGPGLPDREGRQGWQTGMASPLSWAEGCHPCRALLYPSPVSAHRCCELTEPLSWALQSSWQNWLQSPITGFPEQRHPYPHAVDGGQVSNPVPCEAPQGQELCPGPSLGKVGRLSSVCFLLTDFQKGKL